MSNELTTVIIAVVSLGAFWELVKFVFDKIISAFGHKTKSQIDRIETTLATIQEELQDNSEITVAFSRERINELCEKYAALGYIPRKEYVPFKMLGETYIKKNNSEVQIKFEWCIKNLKAK